MFNNNIHRITVDIRHFKKNISLEDGNTEKKMTIR